MLTRRTSSVRVALLLLATALCQLAQGAGSWDLLEKVEVDSQGVFVDNLFAGKSAESLPSVRLAAAPAWGENRVLSRAEVSQLLANVAPNIAANLAGADKVRISRRAEKLTDKELIKQLTDKLMPTRDAERDGELELRLTGQWKPVSVPADNYELRILDKPATGLAPSFMVRFQILSDQETIGTYAVSLMAHLYRQVWVARSAVKAGTTLDKADLVQERRDVINNMREPAWSGQSPNPTFRAKGPITAGAVVYDRAVQKCPVVFRGKPAQATLKDDLLSISTKVDVLEDGAPGDIVKVRNPRTKKLNQGKVTDEGSIEILF